MLTAESVKKLIEKFKKWKEDIGGEQGARDKLKKTRIQVSN